MNPDQLAGALLILACIAFAAISLAVFAVRVMADRDSKLRAAHVLAEANAVVAEAADRPQIVDVDPWQGHTP